MNYLKTAASLCASILVLFSAASTFAAEPRVMQTSSITPSTEKAAESGGTSSIADGVSNLGSSIGNGISSGIDSAKDMIGWKSEPPAEMDGAAGCGKEYQSTETISPAAEMATGGLNCARAGIGQFVDRVVAIQPVKVTGAKDISAAHTEYQSKWDDCQNYQKLAAKVCIADNSEALADGITLVNGLLSAGGAASVYDKCTTFGKAMDIGQKALAAYTAACTMARQPCVMFCGDVKEALTKLKVAIEKVPPAAPGTPCEAGGFVPGVNPLPNPVDKQCGDAYTAFAKSRSNVLSAIKAELDTGNIKASGGKFSRCDRKYWQNVASAGVGIMQLANSLKKGEKCKEESSALAITDPAATCTIPANANLPECICLANPRTAGCSNGLTGVGELSAGSGQVVAGKGIVTDATIGDLGGSDSTGISQGELNNSGAGGSGVGAPTGGGSSLGSIGGGSGSGAGEKGAGSGGKGLNTDILGGTGGGGGGGGGYRGYGDSSGGKGLRSYLPGGAKDPKRGLAGQGVGSKEVTGQAGKSNWEKVRDRYIDNKSSLIGN